MRYIERFINHCKYDLLELTVYDREDIVALNNYTGEQSVCVSMEFASYLRHFSRIENLVITAGEYSLSALEGIYTQKWIRLLVIDYENDDKDGRYQIDISQFPNLEYVFTRSSGNIVGIGTASALRTLVIGKYVDRDLSDLRGSKIDSLCLLKGRLCSLTGLEELPLKIVSISNCKFQKIQPLNTLPALRLLEIDQCGKIIDIDAFANRSLECFLLIGSRSIPSLRFLQQLPNLKRIRLECLVEDHDISWLDNLDDAILFTDKRCYNRKNRDLPKATYAYTIPEIPRWRNPFSCRTL